MPDRGVFVACERVVAVKASVRVLVSAASILVAAACSSSSPTKSSVSPDGGNLTGTALAGAQVLASTSVTHYAYTISPTGVTTVTLLDANNATVGTVTLSRSSSGGAVASYVAADGSLASITSLAVGFGSGAAASPTTMYQRIYSADAQQLEANVVTSNTSGGALGTVELASPQGSQPSSGPILAPTTGFNDVFVMSATTSTAQIERWEGAATPQLVAARAVNTLDPVTYDPNLFQALYKTIQAGVGAGSATATAAANGIGQTVQADTSAACDYGDVSALAAAKDCGGCGVLIGMLAAETEAPPTLIAALKQIKSLASGTSSCNSCAEDMLGPLNDYIACAYPEQTTAECNMTCPGMCPGNIGSCYGEAQGTTPGGGCQCGCAGQTTSDQCQAQAQANCMAMGQSVVMDSVHCGSQSGCTYSCAGGMDAGSSSSTTTGNMTTGMTTTSMGTTGTGTGTTGHSTSSSHSEAHDAGQDATMHDGGHSDATMHDANGPDASPGSCTISLSGEEGGDVACTALVSFSPTAGLLLNIGTAEGTYPLVTVGATLSTTNNFMAGATYTDFGTGSTENGSPYGDWVYAPGTSLGGTGTLTVTSTGLALTDDSGDGDIYYSQAYGDATITFEGIPMVSSGEVVATIHWVTEVVAPPPDGGIRDAAKHDAPKGDAAEDGSDMGGAMCMLSLSGGVTTPDGGVPCTASMTYNESAGFSAFSVTQSNAVDTTSVAVVFPGDPASLPSGTRLSSSACSPTADCSATVGVAMAIDGGALGSNRNWASTDEGSAEWFDFNLTAFGDCPPVMLPGTDSPVGVYSCMNYIGTFTATIPPIVDGGAPVSVSVTGF